ncbi:MAG: hypothetical protein ACUZ8E_07120 [Candidatus Anammoxibacter sp.]
MMKALVIRNIKLTQQLAAEQDKNKILAEQKAVLLAALKQCVQCLDPSAITMKVHDKMVFDDATETIKQSN